MHNLITPARALSLEDALRNLASRLTGTPVAQLPRTQEAIVQYMSEHLPPPERGGADLNALAQAVTREVLARLATEDAKPARTTKTKAKAET